MVSLGAGDFTAGIDAENLLPTTVCNIHVLNCIALYLEEEGKGQTQGERKRQKRVGRMPSTYSFT